LGNEEVNTEDLRKELIELRQQLDRERKLRNLLEEQTRGLEARLYPEQLREIANQVQASMKYHREKQVLRILYKLLLNRFVCKSLLLQ
jgi:transcription factor AP-4